MIFQDKRLKPFGYPSTSAQYYILALCFSMIFGGSAKACAAIR